MLCATFTVLKKQLRRSWMYNYSLLDGGCKIQGMIMKLFHATNLLQMSRVYDCLIHNYAYIQYI